MKRLVLWTATFTLASTIGGCARTEGVAPAPGTATDQPSLLDRADGDPHGSGCRRIKGVRGPICDVPKEAPPADETPPVSVEPEVETGTDLEAAHDMGPAADPDMGSAAEHDMKPPCDAAGS